MLKTRGNQVDVQTVAVDQVKMVHIKDVKVVLPVDRVINEMPDYTKFGRNFTSTQVQTLAVNEPVLKVTQVIPDRFMNE